MTTQKKLWHFPWLYKESFIITAIILAIGYFIQIEVGSFDFHRFSYPVNLISAAALILFCVATAAIHDRPIIKWLSGVPFAIALLGALLVLGLIMGITPQAKARALGDIFSTLGFRQMTSSWPFILIYLLILLSLGVLIVRCLMTPRSRPIAFHMNHIGLWILLAAAGFGHADMARYVMYPELKEEPQWRVYNSAKEFIELPIAIRLNDFLMETYPAKIAIFDAEANSALPVDRPIFYQLNSGSSKTPILDWDIEVNDYIHRAAPAGKEGYRHWPVVGSAPAAQISVRNRSTGEEFKGWISAGSAKGLAQPYVTIPLDSVRSLVMLPPEPKHFASNITVYTQDGKPNQTTTLTVNNPLTIGNWRLYQQGYDETAGEMSVYSAIELVYDPWINGIYLGFALLGLGAFGMIWTGRRKSKEAV